MVKEGSWKDKNVDLEKLGKKVESFFHANKFSEVQSFDDPSGNFIQIQARKTGVFQTLTSQRKALQVIIRGDANLMEFLTGPGKIIFAIPQREREKYLSAGSATVEFENIPKRIEVKTKTSVEKLKQDIKLKLKYLKELKFEKQKIESELKLNEKDMDLKNQTIKKFNQRFRGMSLLKFRNLEGSLAQKYKESTNQLIKYKDNDGELEKVVSELESHRNTYRDSLRKGLPEIEFNTIKKRVNNLEGEISRNEGRLTSVRNKIIQQEVERVRIRKEINNLRIRRNEYKKTKGEESRMKFLIRESGKQRRSIEMKLVSINRKIKLAQTSLKKFKNQLTTMQKIIIVKN